MPTTLDMIARALRLVPLEDWRVVLSPPRLVARFARFALARHAGRSGAFHADDVHARDPELLELTLDLFRALGQRWFRLRVEGIEHVPPHGPVLFVGNHNGGLVPIDGFFTSVAVRDRFGLDRVPYALTHDFVFEDEVLRRYCARLGLLRARHESARHAFAAGKTVLVYPGSDLETFRSFRDRKRVILGGRTGFLELALSARVPIVPVVSVGTHEQLVVLTRGDRLARLFHAHRWARTDVFPIVLAFPWGITSGFVPYLPLPAQTTIAFGEALAWPDLTDEDARRPEVLARCYEQVEARMQTMLDGLSEGRRFLLGKRSPRKAQPSPRLVAT